MKYKLLILVSIFMLLLVSFSIAQFNAGTGGNVNQAGGLTGLTPDSFIDQTTNLNCGFFTGSCPQNKVSIYQLFQTQNSHVSIDGSYPLNICCSTRDFELLDSDVCSGTFVKVLSVSDTKNAHVERGDADPVNYQNAACISLNNAPPSTSLECIYEQGSCPSDYSCLGSISSDSNAHAGICNFYNTNICCRIDLCGEDSIGNTCIEGPTCRTNTTAPNYHGDQNNVVCDNIACTENGCSDCQNQELCDLEQCESLDSFYTGCYPSLDGGLEYRDYFDEWSTCSNGACTATDCTDNYVVIDLGNQLDRNNNNIPDLCDESPCGENTFLSSSQLQSSCFCDSGYSDCNGDLNTIPVGDGCETQGSLCPNVPTCQLLPASTELPEGNTCSCPTSDPLTGRSISTSVCSGGQSCCFGSCVEGECVTTDDDFDDDGMTNECEYKYGLNPYDAIDANHNDDSDQLTNLEECTYGTDPFNPDTDTDGLTDWEEVLPATDTYISNPFEVDTDKDGLNDFVESQIYTTDPSSTDTDQDGLADGDEISEITSWLGLSGDNLRIFTQQTNCEGCVNLEERSDNKKNGPNDDDTDGDTFSDWEEVNLGQDNQISNPFDPTNTCTWKCGEWSPDPCEEGKTQTRRCTASSSSCSQEGKPSESRLCTFTGAPTGRGVPFFSGFNIIFTLLILISYYAYKNTRKK